MYTLKKISRWGYTVFFSGSVSSRSLIMSSPLRVLIPHWERHSSVSDEKRERVVYRLGPTDLTLASLVPTLMTSREPRAGRMLSDNGPYQERLECYLTMCGGKKNIQSTAEPKRHTLYTHNIYEGWKLSRRWSMLRITLPFEPYSFRSTNKNNK